MTREKRKSGSFLSPSRRGREKLGLVEKQERAGSASSGGENRLLRSKQLIAEKPSSSLRRKWRGRRQVSLNLREEEALPNSPEEVGLFVGSGVTDAEDHRGMRRGFSLGRRRDGQGPDPGVSMERERFSTKENERKETCRLRGKRPPLGRELIGRGGKKTSLTPCLPSFGGRESLTGSEM